MPEVRKGSTLIVGAGLIGSSVAMHLAQQGREQILVIDLDLEGQLSSSELNSGGVRATFVQPANIQASKISIEYFAKMKDEVGYRDCGYLWLRDAQTWKPSLAARETQLAQGWEVEAWDISTLRSRVPLIDKTDGIEGAIFAPKDGLINSNLLKQHYRSQAREQGVQFLDRTWMTGAQVKDTGVEVEAVQFTSGLSPEGKTALLSGEAPSTEFQRLNFQVDQVVNCAGPWAPEIARSLGYRIASQPIRRQVCIFDVQGVDLNDYGMIVDTSGVYFHPEATNGLAGFADPQEPPGVNYRYDGDSFFMEKIWPALYERSTHFEALKHVSGWAGLYEVSPDHSAVIGRAKGSRIFEAHSFSGHGAMHSYAAGLGLAELIAKGQFQSIDLGPFSAERFEKGQSLSESLVI